MPKIIDTMRSRAITNSTCSRKRKKLYILFQFSFIFFLSFSFLSIPFISLFGSFVLSLLFYQNFRSENCILMPMHPIVIGYTMMTALSEREKLCILLCRMEFSNARDVAAFSIKLDFHCIHTWIRSSCYILKIFFCHIGILSQKHYLKTQNTYANIQPIQISTVNRKWIFCINWIECFNANLLNRNMYNIHIAVGQYWWIVIKCNLFLHAIDLLRGSFPCARLRKRKYFNARITSMCIKCFSIFHVTTHLL